jgi:hypothetical protein
MWLVTAASSSSILSRVSLCNIVMQKSRALFFGTKKVLLAAPALTRSLYQIGAKKQLEEINFTCLHFQLFPLFFWFPSLFLLSSLLLFCLTRLPLYLTKLEAFRIRREE